MPAVMNGMARNYVTVPPPEVATGGILAVARVVNANPHDLLGAEYQTDACTNMGLWDLYCEGVTEGPPTPKNFDEAPSIVEGDPFTLYTGVECTLQRLDEAADRARNRFNYGERAGVDSAMQGVLEQLATVVPGITGALPVAEAIGVLEDHVYSLYGGPATIVLPMPMIGCACRDGLVSRNLDGSLETCSGSRVANLINGGVTPYRAFACGQITLIRSEMSVISVPQQPLGDGTYEPPRALAERTYVPLIECLVVRVEVTCS